MLNMVLKTLRKQCFKNLMQQLPSANPILWKTYLLRIMSIMLPLMYRKRLFMGFLRFPISFIYFYL